jgi:hypothetical protein
VTRAFERRARNRVLIALGFLEERLDFGMVSEVEAH